MTTRADRLAAKHHAARCWIGTGLGVIATLAFGLTVLQPQWIEAVFDLDPDRGTGWTEQLVVIGLAAAAIVLFAASRREWHAYCSFARQSTPRPRTRARGGRAPAPLDRDRDRGSGE